jgi:mRNA interferase RelE/StbE
VEIRYSKEAKQALLRSNKRKLLLEKIALLADDPSALANNVTQLQGREEWRLRVQDWRFVYLRGEDVLLIRDIAPRSSIYEDKK